MDKKIMSAKDKDGLLYFIIQPVVDILVFWDEDDNDEYAKRIKIANKSCYFYKALYDMANQVKKMLHEM